MLKVFGSLGHASTNDEHLHKIHSLDVGLLWVFKMDQKVMLLFIWIIKKFSLPDMEFFVKCISLSSQSLFHLMAQICYLLGQPFYPMHLLLVNHMMNKLLTSLISQLIHSFLHSKTTTQWRLVHFITNIVTKPSQDQQSSIDLVPMEKPPFCCSTRQRSCPSHFFEFQFRFTNQSSPRYSYPLNSMLAYSHLSPSHHHYLMCLSLESKPFSY